MNFEILCRHWCSRAEKFIVSKALKLWDQHTLSTEYECMNSRGSTPRISLLTIVMWYFSAVSVYPHGGNSLYDTKMLSCENWAIFPCILDNAFNTCLQWTLVINFLIITAKSVWWYEWFEEKTHHQLPNNEASNLLSCPQIERCVFSASVSLRVL